MIQTDIQQDELANVLTLCNSFQLALLYLSTDEEVIQANSMAESLFFRSQKHLINKAFSEICQEFGFEFSIPETSAFAINQNFSNLKTHWVTDKKVFDVSWTVSRVLTGNECIGYLVIGKVMANHIVHQAPAVLDNLLNNHCIGVCIKALDGTYLSFNDYLVDLVGFQSNELIGKNDYLMPWYKEADILRQGDCLAITENSTVVLEEYGTLSDGRQRCFFSTKSPLRDAHDQLIGVICTSIVLHQPRQTLFISDNPTNLFRSTSYEITKTYLTPKEIECISWMIKGKSSSEIASILYISARTVETHLNNIKKKFNCFKQFQLGYLFGKYGHLLL